ncbi:MAG TPA: type II toxin-antitoxin system VapC family toxin [Mariniphaga anaerophila]|uniref:Type II toxin-antitoxin system VapC family toxin n=1 Tax=Mariniphaga anaerophila TaxID=1484053 RepID=A0A831PPC1_9BACT|nr:type II toxin-antitoxin system VapC family toxin [Mariniphaga anaerophila]
MGKRYLLDTNAVLDYMGNKLPGNAKKLIAQVIDEEINLSVINKIELLGFSKVEQDLIDFVACSNIHPMGDAVVDKTIEVRSLYKIKLPDAVIAATALQNGLALVSRNTKDFKNIQGLEVIDPYGL